MVSAPQKLAGKQNKWRKVVNTGISIDPSLQTLQVCNFIHFSCQWKLTDLLVLLGTQATPSCWNRTAFLTQSNFHLVSYKYCVLCYWTCLTFQLELSNRHVRLQNSNTAAASHYALDSSPTTYAATIFNRFYASATVAHCSVQPPSCCRRRGSHSRCEPRGCGRDAAVSWCFEIYVVDEESRVMFHYPWALLDWYRRWLRYKQNACLDCKEFAFCVWVTVDGYVLAERDGSKNMGKHF